MALSVSSLAGFPALNTTFQRSAGTPTDAATYSFTNGVFTAGANTWVAGILDTQGVNPSRIFFSDNNTGGATEGQTVPLPTLVSITQVSASGQSIQELPSTSFEVAANTGYAGFLLVLTPAEPSMDSGGLLGGRFGGPNSSNNGVSTLVAVPGYTTATPTLGYPQPQMRFYVSMSCLLIIASTSTG